MPQLTVSAHFVRALLRGAERHDHKTDRLLQMAGIPGDWVNYPRGRVDAASYARLVRLCWQEMQDEYMGFAEARSKPGTFAAMSYLVIHCQSLESVYRRAANFYSLFERPIWVELTKEGEEAILTLKSDSELWDPDHFFQESLLVIWHRFSCWLIGERIILNGTDFNYSEPRHSGEYPAIFGCPLSFDQPMTRLRFNTRYLTKPLVQDERTLKEFLKSSPADLLGRPDDRTSYSARIRKLLGQEMQDNLPGFEWVAEQLTVSPQTLRRRLKQENTSYQELKDHMRRDIAIYYLARPELSINEIAFKVGFTEPSTFHRAFKKWTGQTPGEYRQSSEISGQGRANEFN